MFTVVFLVCCLALSLVVGLVAVLMGVADESKKQAFLSHGARLRRRVLDSIGGLRDGRS